MANTKISALNALTGANVATNDNFVVVDTSGTETKRITADELRDWIMGAYLGPESEDGEGQAISYTDSAGTSTAITGTYVDITCTTDAFVAFGSAPTAVADGTDYFCSAGLTYRFPITSGNKVSAIRVSASGTMYLHPVS